MASWRVEDPNLELECSCLGRGRGYYDEAERRQYEIETLAVRSWRVDEFDVTLLGDDWSGQFHAGDTYVFRWQYKVSLTGEFILRVPTVLFSSKAYVKLFIFVMRFLGTYVLKQIYLQAAI